MRSAPQPIVSGMLSSLPTLIFLHSWGGSSYAHILLTNLLCSQYQCLAVDFCGWGSSNGAQDPDAYHIRGLSSDIYTLIPHLLPPEHPFILIGRTMGGKVAMHLSSTVESLHPIKPYPKLQGLILLAPAPPNPLVLPAEMAKQQSTAFDTIESAITHTL